MSNTEVEPSTEQKAAETGEEVKVAVKTNELGEEIKEEVDQNEDRDHAWYEGKDGSEPVPVNDSSYEVLPVNPQWWVTKSKDLFYPIQFPSEEYLNPEEYLTKLKETDEKKYDKTLKDTTLEEYLKVVKRVKTEDVPKLHLARINTDCVGTVWNFTLSDGSKTDYENPCEWDSDDKAEDLNVFSFGGPNAQVRKVEMTASDTWLCQIVFKDVEGSIIKTLGTIKPKR